MKINNLTSQGLEYLKQVKRHYSAGKWSQQELLLWHPVPHATSQVTQSSLCEHSQQTCPDVKETGLIYNFFFFPCKALGECVCWLIWKSWGSLGSMSSQIMEAYRGKNPLTWKKVVWVQTAFGEDHQADRAFQLSSALFGLWPKQVSSSYPTKTKSKTTHPDKSGEGRPHSGKPGVCMSVLISVTNSSSPVRVKMQ